MTQASNRPGVRSIRFRAALLASALLTVALIAVTAYSHWTLRRILIQSGEGRAGRVSEQLAALVGPPIPLRAAEIQRLADHDVVRQALLAPSDATVAAAFAHLRGLTSNAAQHQTLELWTAAGRRVMARRFPESASRVPLSDTPPSGAGVLPYKAVAGGIVVLDIVARVPAPDTADEAGYLLVRRGAVNPNASDVLDRLVGDGGRIMLGNQSGSLWINLTGSIENQGIGPMARGVHHYRRPNGDERIGGVAHVAGTPLAVLVEFPTAFFIAPANTLLQQLLLVGVVFIAIAIAVVWHLSRRITHPLNELTDAARAMSAGDFSRRVAAASDSEVGRLGGAFNLMAGTIQQAMTDLESRARTIEDHDRRKAAMMNAALDGIITTDLKGRIVDCNPAAEFVFRHRHGSIIGRDLHALLGLPRFEEYRNLEDYVEHADALRLGTRQEWKARRSDGTTFPAEAVVVAIRSQGDVGFAAFIRDLTEQRAAEDSVVRGVLLEEENRRVQEASRMKSEFLANMSHELRTPLNAIIGFAELLYDGQVTPEMPEFRDFMHDILKSGQHLLQLINDVLDLSKIEAGRLEFHPEETSLDQVIDESLSILRTLAAQKQISIVHEIDPAVDRVFIDRGRLKQVLYNYLSNAIKFTPERGTITIRVAPEGADHIRIAVTDTGIGIAAGDVSRLFVEFNQLEAGAGKKHQGTGLGLALTRRLVEAQGGTVGVDSTPGSGSTFWAILPRRAAAGTPLANPRSIPSARIGAPLVLVIEDDPADQEAIVKVLNEAGFNIETANSRAQALTKLTRQGFDAITLDLILPDASGADVLRDIKASERNRDVPVVVITIVAHGGAVTGFAVHDILTKPVDAADIIGALDHAGVSASASGSVLVVDDDPGSLRLMAASLQQLGYRATCVERAVDGLRLSERDTPLAVVLDLQMPGLDGFGFLDHFRRIPGCEAVPVIVWTVRDLTPADRERLKSSAQGIMSKGQSGRSVADELRRFVAERQA